MLEDEIFEDALITLRLNLTKDDYEPTTLVHKCDMCGEENTTLGYRRKNASCLVPYLFICKDCYKELKNNETINSWYYLWNRFRVVLQFLSGTK